MHYYAKSPKNIGVAAYTGSYIRKAENKSYWECGYFYGGDPKKYIPPERHLIKTVDTYEEANQWLTSCEVIQNTTAR